MTALPRTHALESVRIEEPAVFRLAVELVMLHAERRLIWLERLVTQGGSDDPNVEQTFYSEHESMVGLDARIDAIRRELAEDPAFTRAVRFLHLEPGESDLFLGCLAHALEPALGDLFARLNGHLDRCYPTEPLLARLFGWGRQPLWRAGSHLASLMVIHTFDVGLGRAPALSLDPLVLEWLQGRPAIEEELIGVARIVVGAPSPLSSWPIRNTVERLRKIVANHSELRLVIVGPRGSGRRSFAIAVLDAVNLESVLIDTDAIDDARWPELHLRANRLALLRGGVVVWHGSRLDRRWPRAPHSSLQVVICEDPRALAPHPEFVDEIIEMPALTLDERRALWASFIPEASTWPSGELDRLAARHRLAVGDIAEIAARAPADPREAAVLAREQTRGRLGELGRLLDCPFGWDDLVVSEKLREELSDFAFEASERARFWEQATARRLFPRGTGLVGLFTGPPGTGKTMAAQVIAAELQLDLFRIDLATVVSKYIGETAKNLDRIFSRASRMNAVLLFDEADALFSKRTDVRDSHDRYANADTNYLLQLLEDYQGIALLATNKKNNLDPAFIRRIRYVIDFPRPDLGQRRAIWRKIVGEMASPEILRRLEPTIAVLAETVDVSGAQIKNALLAALFGSRRTQKPLDIDHVIRGLERELGKEGRTLGERERARLRRPT